MMMSDHNQKCETCHYWQATTPAGDRLPGSRPMPAVSALPRGFSGYRPD
jgi:hypothetical protein